MRQLLVLLLLVSVIHAQDDSTKVVELENVPVATILEDEGETIRVRGFVDSTNTNATGINFLDFKGSDFVCVTFGRHVNNFPDGPPAEVYKDKWIEVTGEIQKYRGNPQIRIESPDQVKILDKPVPKPPEPEPEPAAQEEMPEEVTGVETKPVETEPAPVENETGRELEVVDGVPAIDWRKYFPE